VTIHRHNRPNQQPTVFFFFSFLLAMPSDQIYPPPQGFTLNIEALSGILGSVSIACWMVVFSPQIIENFRRGSANGLSVIFIIAWLSGDVFNILGAVFQGVLPTMVGLVMSCH